MRLCGTPDDQYLNRITSNEARNYIRSLEKMDKKNFQSEFQNCNPEAVDLLEKMLELDYDRRITATHALEHPYLKDYADPSDEPTSEKFDDSFEDSTLNVSQWKGKFSFLIFF